MGYSAIAAGSAALPVTAILLVFSSKAGALATRIGPRLPLTLGPIGIAAGMLLMLRIDPGDSYLSTVFPAVVVYGAGLALVVAPVTATVLAAADDRHAGVASGINNAVARVAGLVAVAVLPLIAGLSGEAFFDPAAMDDGFKIAMVVTAALSLLGGAIAFFMIQSDVLEETTRTTARVPPRTELRGGGHAAQAGPARGRARARGRRYGRRRRRDPLGAPAAAGAAGVLGDRARGSREARAAPPPRAAKGSRARLRQRRPRLRGAAAFR